MKKQIKLKTNYSLGEEIGNAYNKRFISRLY